MKARSIQIARNGGPDEMALATQELGPPRAGEVQVRHHAIGVNFIDVYHRTGLYPLALPSGLGLEAAGVVEAVGEGVSDLRVGQRVAYAGGAPGAYADVRNVVADRVVPLPDDVPSDVAAASLLKGMTVEYLVRRTFPVEREMVVLWHAAAGGVGSLAIPWLKALGAVVIGTMSSEAKAERARALGCDHTLIYNDDTWPERVRAIAPGGVHVVYDSVGRRTFLGSLACLRPRGMLVGFGNASGPPGPFDPMELARRGSLFLTRASLFDYTRSRAELLMSAGALFEQLQAGVVRPEIGLTLPLAEAAEAHRKLEGRATTGSVVLTP